MNRRADVYRVYRLWRKVISSRESPYIPSIISSILTSLSSIDNDEDNILSICFAFVYILSIGFYHAYFQCEKI